MSRRSVALGVGLALLLAVPGAAPRAGAAGPGAASAGEEPGEDELDDELEDEADALRQHLTEREDKRRPIRPWSASVGGRPLTLGGEYEIEIGGIGNRVLVPGEPPDELFFEQGLEVESFYSFGPSLSLFAQVRAVMEADLLTHTFEPISDLYLERGEMWIDSEGVAGTGFSVDAGRIDFEDDRRWWWDDELDAARVTFESERLEVALAVGEELLPARSDRSFVEPRDDDVFRVIGEASWDWRPGHALELFGLYQDDHSSPEREGEVFGSEREDDSDARLTWLGARAIGVLPLGARGGLGYWLDAALVRGRERFAELETLPGGRSAVEETGRRGVSGWALDAGLSWILPFAAEPRLFAGYALGSGDPDPEAGDDRSFRQTGLEDNEAGFGGVERFPHYGFLLDPELSNLGVVTLGAGVSLFRSSSLDLVFHHYRLAEPGTELPDSQLEATLDGRHRDLGQELDLVLALEEWERLELFVVVSGFRAGRAFGPERGSWSYGALAAMRIAF